MKKLFVLVVLLAVACTPAFAQLQTVFSEDFESGVNGWTLGTGMSISDVKAYDGVKSLYSTTSADRAWKSIGSELTSFFKATWWIYDDTATRAFGELRAYSGSGYNNGSFQNLFAMGKYNNVSLTGDIWKGTKYQGRISTTGYGWFNLDAEGSVNRSAGWHKFDMIRTTDGTLSFYVDDKLGREFTNVPALSIDSITLGLGTGTTAGNAYYDAVSIVTPEPGSFVALASGLVGMAGFAIRRRK